MPSMVWIAYSTVEWKIVTLSMLQITTFKMLYIERALKSLIKMEYISLERLCECELDWECWRFLVFWFNTEIRQEICNLTFVGFAVNLAHRNTLIFMCGGSKRHLFISTIRWDWGESKIYFDAEISLFASCPSWSQGKNPLSKHNCLKKNPEACSQRLRKYCAIS